MYTCVCDIDSKRVRRREEGRPSPGMTCAPSAWRQSCRHTLSCVVVELACLSFPSMCLCVQCCVVCECVHRSGSARGSIHSPSLRRRVWTRLCDSRANEGEKGGRCRDQKGCRMKGAEGLGQRQAGEAGIFFKRRDKKAGGQVRIQRESERSKKTARTTHDGQFGTWRRVAFLLLMIDPFRCVLHVR